MLNGYHRVVSNSADTAWLFVIILLNVPGMSYNCTYEKDRGLSSNIYLKHIPNEFLVAALVHVHVFH